MDTAGNIYKPLSLHHSFIDDTLTINQPYILPPYQAINGSPCYNYIWVVQDPDGFALSGPGEDNIFTPTKPGRYRFTLIVQDEGGEQVSTQFELWVEESVGMENLSPGSGLYIGPNPFSDELCIYSTNAEITRLLIYDIQGREIMRNTLPYKETHYLSTMNWATGIYLIKCFSTDGREMSSHKLIKVDS